MNIFYAKPRPYFQSHIPNYSKSEFLIAEITSNKIFLSRRTQIRFPFRDIGIIGSIPNDSTPPLLVSSLTIISQEVAPGFRV